MKQLATPKIERVQPKKVTLPRCTALVSEESAAWRGRDGREDPNVCNRTAKFCIEGQNLCQTHAGAAALLILLREVDDA